MPKPIYLGLILEETPWNIVLTPKSAAQPEATPPAKAKAKNGKPKKSAGR